ncbi:UNVERIFIED_CONTAM: hypothetical protein RMT77_009852 [Armadillidium vulgare]
MNLQTTFCLLLGLVLSTSAQLIHKNVIETSVKDVRIFCNSNDIVLSIDASSVFNGMIYPKGLSKNSSCMSEYKDQKSPILYKLPLKSCNTMSAELEDGVEYFNTVVVQPHLKLVTNQGRGYHIRCKYQTQEKTITNTFNVTGEFGGEGKEGLNGSSLLGTTPLTATAPMPGCYMRIFAGNPSDRQVAENVRIGDPLTLVISLDTQEIYGMIITNCLVRDGLGWGEQMLINNDGCPVDYEILGPFEYSKSKTTASVKFQAHKFPYTDSVYYQCNVKLCIKNAGGCDEVPPICIEGENIVKRRRRREVSEIDASGDLSAVEPEVNETLTIEVFTGLYVNEEEELPDPDRASVETAGPAREEVDDPDTFCLSPRTFALGIAIAGLILMIAVIAAILILIKRRLRGKDHSTTGSSIYSGPYTNTAYSHSS